MGGGVCIRIYERVVQRHLCAHAEHALVHAAVIGL
jgi:hypothetical protein